MKFYLLIIVLVALKGNAQDTIPVVPSYNIPTAVVDDSVFADIQKAFLGKVFVFKQIVLPEEKMISAGTRLTCIKVNRIDSLPKRWLSPIDMITLCFSYKDTGHVDIDLYAINSSNAFTRDQANRYAKLFGGLYWRSILKSHVNIGMTPEMCRLAWGEPDEVRTNENSSKGITSIWYYDYGRMLIFRKGLLDDITH